MKFFSLMSCIFLAPLSAFAAGVVADIPAGNYTHPIEVRLSTDLPDADIFYYTDGKGYFETISPYEKPILLKKNTQLDFFAMTPDMNQTPIYTQVYTFSYPDIFTLSIWDGEIHVQNTTSQTHSLWLRILETADMHYEVDAQNMLSGRAVFTLPYSLTEEETIFLYSPDGIRRSQITVPKKEVIKIQPVHIPTSIPVLSQQASAPISEPENTNPETPFVEIHFEENIWESDEVSQENNPVSENVAPSSEIPWTASEYQTETSLHIPDILTEEWSETMQDDHNVFDSENSPIEEEWLFWQESEENNIQNVLDTSDTLTEETVFFNSAPMNTPDQNSQTNSGFVTQDIRTSVSDAWVKENKLSNNLSIVGGIVFLFLFAYNIGLYFLGRKNTPGGKKEM